MEENCVIIKCMHINSMIVIHQAIIVGKFKMELTYNLCIAINAYYIKCIIHDWACVVHLIHYSHVPYIWCKT